MVLSIATPAKPRARNAHSGRIPCPRCHHPRSIVLDSRSHEDGEGIRRRRECLRCHFRFRTLELLIPEDRPDEGILLAEQAVVSELQRGRQSAQQQLELFDSLLERTRPI